ncbi:MAG: hypothetical protein NTY04_04325 [Candidatus Staskawiczbacteria bacterium]|nr:hypothetical protein [Candidatus Staskawiczbacteria bacterium]
MSKRDYARVVELLCELASLAAKEGDFRLVTEYLDRAKVAVKTMQDTPGSL